MEKKKSLIFRLKQDIRRNGVLYLLVLPVLVFYILFHYKPMYGTLIAFKDFQPRLGIMGSPWVGFDNFKAFFTNPYFMRVLKNTLVISVSNLLFTFPAPIILALLINEMRGEMFKKGVQTISYLPHFISLVVVCSMVKEFTSSDGFVTDIAVLFGMERQTMLNNQNLFVPIYILSDIWQNVGWSSIIYLAALTGIDTELYDAASIDGAGRFKKVLYVTIPGILPQIIIMLILAIGGMMNVGYEKIILLYNPATYNTADVINSYVYREGLVSRNYGYSTAVGLFNSVINCILLFASNHISKKVSDTSLW